jgi:hypothetical protein
MILLMMRMWVWVWVKAMRRRRVMHVCTWVVIYSVVRRMRITMLGVINGGFMNVVRVYVGMRVISL